MKLKKALICILSISLVCGAVFNTVGAKPNYTVYKPAPYVQNNVVSQSKSDVIELVMDYSGSMSSWINLAKNTMRTILPQIPSTTRVGLRVFGQNVLVQNKTTNSNNLLVNVGDVLMNSIGTFSLNSCQATKQVTPLSVKNTDALISGMNSVLTGGSTPLTLALEKTVYSDFAGLDINTKKKIILISDGAENCGGNACSFVKNLAATRKDIQIDVILVGSSSRLRCLSDATGGKFYNVDSNQDFNNALGVTFETKPQSTIQTTQGGNSYKPQTQNNNSVHYQYLPD